MALWAFNLARITHKKLYCRSYAYTLFLSKCSLCWSDYTLYHYIYCCPLNVTWEPKMFSGDSEIKGMVKLRLSSIHLDEPEHIEINLHFVWLWYKVHSLAILFLNSKRFAVVFFYLSWSHWSRRWKDMVLLDD